MQTIQRYTERERQILTLTKPFHYEHALHGVLFLMELLTFVSASDFTTPSQLCDIFIVLTAAVERGGVMGYNYGEQKSSRQTRRKHDKDTDR